MSCPDELTLMRYVDGALTGETLAATATHVQGCADCRQRTDALRQEAALLSAALGDVPQPRDIPPFEPPLSSRATVAVAVLVGLASALALTTPLLPNLSLPPALDWLDPFDAWSFADLSVSTALFFVQRGGTIVLTLLEATAILTGLALLLWMVNRLRHRGGGSLALLTLVAAGTLTPSPADALDIRRSDGTVQVAAAETVNDTLVAMGRNIEIDGTIDGDLIAAGRQVTIRGSVTGNVYAAAQSVTIEGSVGGSVLGFAEALDVRAAELGRNLYGFAETLTTGPGARIRQNAVVFAQRANVGGRIGIDLLGFAETLEVASTIDGGLLAWAEHVALLSGARVGADATLHVPEEDAVTVSPGAEVVGELTTHVRVVEPRRSRYATGDWYGFQALRFAAAFVTGLVLLWLFPGLRRLGLESAGNAAVAGGIGLVTLVAVPVIAVLVGITLVGLPLAVITALLWLLGLYLAKIVVAHFVGARAFAGGERRHYALALALGLLVVIVAINLPMLGGLLNFLLTIIGLGMLVLYAWNGVRGNDRPGAPAP